MLRLIYWIMIFKCSDSFYYTCDKQVLWDSAGAFFPRDNSRFSPQVAKFSRSWSSGKMLAFRPIVFVFEPVRMR